eukprot:4309552-Amphidinium_carterae.1
MVAVLGKFETRGWVEVGARLVPCEEWSDLNAACDKVPIHPYGAGDQSGARCTRTVFRVPADLLIIVDEPPCAFHPKLPQTIEFFILTSSESEFVEDCRSLSDERRGTPNWERQPPGHNHAMQAEWKWVGLICLPPSEPSGTFDFFAEAIFTNVDEKPESFAFCNTTQVHHLEHLSAAEQAHNRNYGSILRSQGLSTHSGFRDELGSSNCYCPSEDDELIRDWILADTGGIAYFGFAYYVINQAVLTVIRVADDYVKGIADTDQFIVNPDTYSITDGLRLSCNRAAWIPNTSLVSMFASLKLSRFLDKSSKVSCRCRNTLGRADALILKFPTRPYNANNVRNGGSSSPHCCK